MSHLRISLKASDTAMLKHWDSGREAPHAFGYISRNTCYFRQSQGLHYCPVQCHLLQANVLLKLFCCIIRGRLGLEQVINDS